LDARNTGLLQLALALAIVGVAVAFWLHRDKVEAAASSILGVGEPVSREVGRRRGGSGALPVVVARVGEGRDDVVVDAIGTARARKSVTLYPPIAGEIIESQIKAGARIAKDEPLIRLDAKKAELAIAMARSNLLDAERKLDRSKQLQSRNVASRATVDDAQTAFDRAKVELSQAEETLRDLTIRAPFAGVLGIPKVERGDRVSTTTAIVTLDDRAELIVEFEVPERYMPRLRPEHAVTARTPGFPREVFNGSVRSIDSRVDPTARTVVVRAAIPNAADKLRPGMSFAVEIRLEGQLYPAVPELALQFSRTGNYVWVIEDEKARQLPVRLVRRFDATALIDAPLKSGSLVVIEGVQRLRPDRQVRFAQPPARPDNGQRQAVN
jgi:RND family efflux transporter MFP subunit